MKSYDSDFREYSLDNGLRVCLKNTQTETISGSLRVHFGAINEREGEEGLAHLLEHVLISGGSQKYSPDKMEELTSMFGYYNGSTNLNQTTFPVDILSEDLELYLDYVSQITFKPLFDLERFEQQRNVVLREISRKKSSPCYKDRVEFYDSLFGINHPYSYEISGKEDNIETATVEDLRNLHSRGYGARNMDLTLVGGLPRNTEQLVEKYFGGQREGECTRLEFDPFPPIDERVLIYRSAPDLLNSDRPDDSSSELYIGLHIPGKLSEGYFPNLILRRTLGGGSDSRLFKKIREEMGLAYSIRCKGSPDKNFGFMLIKGEVESSRSEEAIDAAFDEMAWLRENRISERDLKMKKRKVRYNLTKLYEGNEGIRGLIESSIDGGVDIDDPLGGLDSVTVDNVMESAIKSFPENRDDNNYVLMLRDPPSEER